MKIHGFETHPAADLYPMLSKDELDELADDIAENGLQDSIVMTPEKTPRILDGRNRYTACIQAKVKPRFTTYAGKMDMDSLVSFVESKNDKRRHLTASQRAMIGAMAAELRHGERPVGESAEKATQKQIAKGKRVSVRSIGHGKTVLEKAPPQVKEAVLAGKLTIDAAADLANKLPPAEQKKIVARIMKKGGGEVKSGHVRALVRQEDRRQTVRKINEGRVGPMPMGPFRVLVSDFPWPYKNSDGHAGSRGHITYPKMEISELAELRHQVLPRLHDDCIWFGYATNYFIRDMPYLVAEWGFEWRTVMTLVKSHMVMGTWPRGRTEHIVIASRGKPVHTLNELTTWLGDRVIEMPEEHSRKPTVLLEAIEKHCSGPYLELFARESFSNKWQVWGAETEKFTRAA